MRASGVGLDLVANVVSPQKLAGMVSGQRCRHRQRVPPLAQRACAGCAAATVGAVRAGAVRPGSKRASVRVRARAWQERGAARLSDSGEDVALEPAKDGVERRWPIWIRNPFVWGW
jgi:hypothetical protein